MGQRPNSKINHEANCRTTEEAGGAGGRRGDIAIAALMGLSFGILAIPILLNLQTKRLAVLIALPPSCAVAFGAAFFTVYALVASSSSLYQIAKFGIVGALNSTVDFGIMNLLILLTGLTSGAGFLAIKSISASLGVTNSYLCNKYWTFERLTSAASLSELLSFLVVSLVGVGLNVLGAAVVVNVIGAPSSVSPRLWANIGALSAAALTMIANFLGYKYLVFRQTGSTK